jgi:hypothetical protein
MVARLTECVHYCGVYVATLLGVLASQAATYIPVLLRHEQATPFFWTRLWSSIVITIVVLARSESQGDQHAKRGRIHKRLAVAFMQGYTCNGIIGAINQ